MNMHTLIFSQSPFQPPTISMPLLSLPEDVFVEILNQVDFVEPTFDRGLSRWHPQFWPIYGTCRAFQKYAFETDYMLRGEWMDLVKMNEIQRPLHRACRVKLEFRYRQTRKFLQYVLSTSKFWIRALKRRQAWTFIDPDRPNAIELRVCMSDVSRQDVVQYLNSLAREIHHIDTVKILELRANGSEWLAQTLKDYPRLQHLSIDLSTQYCSGPVG